MGAPTLSLVPRNAFPTGGYGNDCDIRMTKDCAMMVTLVLERIADDAPRQRLWHLASFMDVVSGYALMMDKVAKR